MTMTALRKFISKTRLHGDWNKFLRNWDQRGHAYVTQRIPYPLTMPANTSLSQEIGVGLLLLELSMEAYLKKFRNFFLKHLL